MSAQNTSGKSGEMTVQAIETGLNLIGNIFSSINRPGTAPGQAPTIVRQERETNLTGFIFVGIFLTVVLIIIYKK